MRYVAWGPIYEVGLWTQKFCAAPDVWCSEHIAGRSDSQIQYLVFDVDASLILVLLLKLCLWFSWLDERHLIKLHNMHAREASSLERTLDVIRAKQRFKAPFSYWVVSISCGNAGGLKCHLACMSAQNRAFDDENAINRLSKRTPTPFSCFM